MGWIEKVKNIERLSFFQIQFLIVLLVYVGSVVLFFQVDAIDIHTAWTTPRELEYGYLVFFLAAVLIVRNAKYVDQTEPLYWPLIILVAISVVYWIGAFLEVRTFRHLCLFLGFPFFSLAVLGKNAWDVTWVPCCVVIMALPAGYLLLPYLQQFTVLAVTSLIRLTPMTAYIEGAYIHLPEGIVWIKEGCSGHKYFITAGTLALMVSAYDRRGLLRSLPVVGLALLLSIIANWIRVFVLVLVGYFSGMDHPLMDDHDNLGWVVFVVMMIPFFYLSSKGARDRELISEANNPGSSAEEIDCCEPGLMNASDASENSPNNDNIIAQRRFSGALIAAQLLVLVGGLGILIVPNKIELLGMEGAGRGRASVTFQSSLNDGVKVFNKDRQWYPNYSGATEEGHASYQYLDQEVEASILLYATQTQGKELDNTENTIFDKKRWRVKSKRVLSLTDFSGEKLSAFVVEAGRSGESWVAVYWHRVNGINARPGLRSKMLSLSRVWDYKSDDMLIALATACHPNCTLAEERLVAFVKRENYFSLTNLAEKR